MMRTIVILISATLAFLTTPGNAISENNYLETYSKEVIPHYEHLETGHVKGVHEDKEINLVYKVFHASNETNAIVLLPGRGMSIMNYSETIYDLRNAGFTIYTLGHRGQGESSRVTKNPQMQYVKSFEEYVSDLSAFMDQVVKPKNHPKLFLLSDSMGGAIGSLYINRNPGVFHAALMVVPMFGIGTSTWAEATLFETAKAMVGMGFGEYYGPRQGDFKAVPASESALSRSEIRYGMANYIFTSHPELKTGGISYQWFVAAQYAIGEIRKPSFKLQLPTLIVTAQKDRVVNNTVATTLCKTWTNCALEELKDSYHGVFMERDSIRNLLLQKITDFFEKLS